MLDASSKEPLDALAKRNRQLAAARQRPTRRDQIRLRGLQLIGPLLRRSTPTSALQNILIIRPDHLGDVLFTTPMFHWLKQALPQVRLTALVGPWSVHVLRANPDVDEAIELPFPGFTRTAPGSLWQPYQLLMQWARRLRAQAFDAALVLRGDHWWGAWLAAQAGIPRRVGYAVPETTPFLTTALPLPAAHDVVRNLTLASALVKRDLPPIQPGTPPLHFPLTPDDQRFAAELSATPLIAIHPGAGAAVKLWEVAKWAQVADALAHEFGAHLVLTGSPAEVPLCAQIAEHVQASTPVTILAGKTSVGQLAALFARCALVLGPDSGPLHLAVAMGTPTVHLYGPADVATFGPWGDPARHCALLSPLPCAPCWVLDWAEMDQHPCVRLIEVEDVVQAARRVLLQ